MLPVALLPIAALLGTVLALGVEHLDHDAGVTAELRDDDECSGDDASDACVAEFRQLRGQARVSHHEFANEDPVVSSTSTQSGPFCCFSGASPSDVCGTCYGNAFAPQGELYHNSTVCTQSNETCMLCNATWCDGVMPVKIVDPPVEKHRRRRRHTRRRRRTALLMERSVTVDTPSGPFCCFSGAQQEDMCGTCYGNAFAPQGEIYHNSTVCSQSNETCMSCNGTWCDGPMPEKVVDPPVEQHSRRRRGHSRRRRHPSLVQLHSVNGTATGEFCCFSGAVQEDMCGTCYGNAFAPRGELYHNSTVCTQSNETCMSCNGTWCDGPMPVKVIDPPLEKHRRRRRRRHSRRRSRSEPH